MDARYQFTAENTDGWTDEQLDALNEELERRLRAAGYDPDADQDDWEEFEQVAKHLSGQITNDYAAGLLGGVLANPD